MAAGAGAQEGAVPGPSVSGQTGLISMPDARFAPEGAWRSGLSFMRPYQTIWSGVTVFPWFEGSFRYTRIYHVPAFPGRPGEDFGDYRDKSFDTKLRLLPERAWWPALAVGVQDFGGGTGLFRAPYAVASKRFGDLDLTLGVGDDRIDGAFGGLRWNVAPRWSLLAEYDAYDYPSDRGAILSGAAEYKKEAALGVEYRGDWGGAKAFAAHGELGFNVYVELPLERREFVPKIDEPAPYTRINPRPTEAQWHADASHRRRLARALAEQDFRDVTLGYRNGRLEATLTNTRISAMPRAVGRAARTLLSFAPLEVREIRVTYRRGILPVATYTFIDAALLQRYFNGMASRELLAPYVAIEYAKPSEAREEEDRAETLAAFEEPLPEALVVARPELDLIGFGAFNVAGGRLRFHPSLSIFFNDPSGAFKYDLGALASYDRPLGRNTFLQADARLSLLEDISDVTQPSNSLLPHVRTDVAEYKRGSRLKLNRLLVNRFFHPRERVYARASAGLYEEMYSGAGGQVLYLPASGRWALDLAADALRQRDFDGGFGHRDYSTVTAIGSLHYRMAHGVTATLRAGRFLARDEGVRGEIKRRFASGIEVGAWYTVTNGNDITSPGAPGDPYHDKGIFVAMPLETLLTRDTQASASFAIAPWTRDVGQMVASPGDLYRILERPTLEMHRHDGLVEFGDRADDYDLPSLGAERRWPDFLGPHFAGARRAAGEIDWVESGVLAAGITLGAAALDSRLFRFADKRKDRDWMKRGVELGDALPVAAVGLSALFAFDESRPQLSNAGVAALEAAALALVGSTAAKYAVGRARPTAGLGRSEFEPGSDDRFHSFPSRHTAVMWAAVTPYAKEFGLPGLYGLAALTNAARVGSREHWFSDTVAGALLGYAAGHLAWEARRGGPQLRVGPRGAALAWELP